MREDMFKVIVERPRWGSRMRTNEGRRYRASEDVASKIGIKQGYVTRKYLNENLSPLKRWLESQANRPWDKVYAELCANIDRRNTVQQHIFAHIDSFVERETRLVDGKVFVLSRWGRELQLVQPHCIGATEKKLGFAALTANLRSMSLMMRASNRN
jgi:hypothetical protein